MGKSFHIPKGFSVIREIHSSVLGELPDFRELFVWWKDWIHKY